MSVAPTFLDRPASDSEYATTLKIGVVGETAVGKSSLLFAYTNQAFVGPLLRLLLRPAPAPTPPPVGTKPVPN